jgi:hypothetical protein
MNLRIDKVIRSVGLGFRKVCSLVLTDAGLYILYTGGVRALKHYRLDAALNQVIADHATDRSVKQLQANEARIDSTPLDELVNESGNYLVRLDAIEEVEIRAGQLPTLIVHVTGSDHHLAFPLTPLDQIEMLQRTLDKWSVKKSA